MLKKANANETVNGRLPRQCKETNRRYGTMGSEREKERSTNVKVTIRRIKEGILWQRSLQQCSRFWFWDRTM